MMRFTIKMPVGRQSKDYGMLSKGVDLAADLVLTEIIKELLPHRSQKLRDGRKNHLDESWKVVKLSNHSARVQSDNPAADYLDRGTGPHPISARNKRSLSFVTAGRSTMGAGGRIFHAEAGDIDNVAVKSVKRHPGNAGIHYIDKVQAKTRRGIEELLTAAGETEVDLRLGDVFGEVRGLPGRGGRGSGGFRVRGGNPLNTGQFSRLRG